MTKSFSKRSLRGAAAVVLATTGTAAIVAVGPSFATSFLTQKQAAKTFVKKKEAKSTYLSEEAAESAFLTNKSAKEQYALKEDLPQVPLVRTVASTVDVGPVSTTTPWEIPGARAVFKTASTTNVVITFSGQATCTAATNGLGCPIQLLVDGSPTGTGRVNFLTSRAATPQAKEQVSTVVQTGVVTPGQHVITARYAGATDPSINFKLFDWNLVVEAYPGSDVVVEEEE